VDRDTAQMRSMHHDRLLLVLHQRGAQFQFSTRADTNLSNFAQRLPSLGAIVKACGCTTAWRSDREDSK
jgi:hypothetical protein